MTGVELAARICGVRLIDYERTSSGVLIASGSGLMMSIMDHAPGLRWAVEYDGHPRARWEDFAEAVEARLVIAGWFSITDPRELRAAALRAPRSLTYAGCGTPLGGRQQPTLQALLASLQGWAGVQEIR